ncbi:hypothetical protein Scep_018997 [Stephania cephalantha]|uniref:Uncharacterized protein n=1 Tax=Stephania cephalantha TaxID=152367 RepID=A0AAP0IA32_9MAGN
MKTKSSTNLSVEILIRDMGTPASGKIRYEDLRNARISENQSKISLARLATLGLEKSLSELRAIVLSPKQPPKQFQKKVYDSSSLKRSSRLKGETQVSYCDSRRYSVNVKQENVDSTSSLEGKGFLSFLLLGVNVTLVT